jgi:hypothetical protein
MKVSGGRRRDAGKGQEKDNGFPNALDNRGENRVIARIIEGFRPTRASGCQRSESGGDQPVEVADPAREMAPQAGFEPATLRLTD